MVVNNGIVLPQLLHGQAHSVQSVLGMKTEAKERATVRALNIPNIPEIFIMCRKSAVRLREGGTFPKLCYTTGNTNRRTLLLAC